MSCKLGPIPHPASLDCPSDLVVGFQDDAQSLPRENRRNNFEATVISGAETLDRQPASKRYSLTEHVKKAILLRLTANHRDHGLLEYRDPPRAAEMKRRHAVSVGPDKNIFTVFKCRLHLLTICH